VNVINVEVNALNVLEIFGVSIVIIRALYTVQNPHVEGTMGLAKDAKMVSGVNCVIFLVSQLTIVNIMLTVLKQLVYAKIV